jgi:hypothetical protein
MDFRTLWTKFRGTVFFRLLYLVLVAGAVSLLLPQGRLCFPLLLIPVLMLLIPHWFGERKIRNHALNALFVILVSALFYALLITPVVTSQEQVVQTHADVNKDVALADGRVDPFRTGRAAETFRFTVNLTTDHPDRGNFTVRVLMIDFEGLQFVPRFYAMLPASGGNGDLADGENFTVGTTLPQLYHYGFNFQVLTIVNTTQTVFTETRGSPGPYNAPYAAYFGFELYQGLVGMLIISVGFFLLLLLYWWTRKAREIRGVRAPGRKRDEGGGEYTCTNCGGDVAEADTKCPNCGAEFVEARVEPAEFKA